jgi:hypothetical protein
MTPPRKTIVRTPKVERYVVVDNAVFNDERLSWEARGLMGYLLTKPDHWQVRLHDLLTHGPAGEHKLRRILEELRKARYVRRHRIRRADGTFEWITMIYESPDGADT